MNQMVLYSKVVTIRDKQLNENKRLESEWIEEQKKIGFDDGNWEAEGPPRGGRAWGQEIGR